VRNISHIHYTKNASGIPHSKLRVGKIYLLKNPIQNEEFIVKILGLTPLKFKILKVLHPPDGIYVLNEYFVDTLDILEEISEDEWEKIAPYLI